LTAVYGLDRPERVLLSAGNRKPTGFDAKKFDKAVRYVYRQGGFTPDMLRNKPIVALTKETAQVLMDAFNSTLINEEIPEAMAEKLREDVFVFSGCKTYHELREATQLLTDEDGGIKPLYQFMADVKELHPKYNEQYLEAEHEFAIHSAQAAAQWADIQEDGDEYDLQYCTAGDAAVRPDHAALEGITLPASDSFWTMYMPPNGWRCRCLVKQVLRGKYQRADSDRALRLGEQATTDTDNQGRNRAAMFRFNPGTQQVLFPPNHPYYHNAPEEAKQWHHEQ